MKAKRSLYVLFELKFSCSRWTTGFHKTTSCELTVFIRKNDVCSINSLYIKMNVSFSLGKGFVCEFGPMTATKPVCSNQTESKWDFCIEWTISLITPSDGLHGYPLAGWSIMPAMWESALHKWNSHGQIDYLHKDKTSLYKRLHIQ